LTGPEKQTDRQTDRHMECSDTLWWEVSNQHTDFVTDHDRKHNSAKVKLIQLLMYLLDARNMT